MRILDEKSQEAHDFLADAYLCFSCILLFREFIATYCLLFF